MHMCTYQEPCEVYLRRSLRIPPPMPQIARHMWTYQQHISTVVLVSHAYVHISKALLRISTKVSYIPAPTPQIARHMCTYQQFISTVVLVSHAYVHISRALWGISTKISTHTPTYAADSKAYVNISTAYLSSSAGISCICAHIKSLVRYIYQGIYTYPHLRRR